MTAYPKIMVATIISLTLTAFLLFNAHSYVLQGPHIIQLMTDKLGPAESLFISQRVIFYPFAPQPDAMEQQDYPDTELDTAGQPSGLATELSDTAPTSVEPQPIQLEESIRYVFSKAFRSDIVSDTNQRIYVYNQGQSITVIDGVIANFTESRFDLYKDLLLYRSRETLEARLMTLGIDVTVSSLGKYDEQLALVIGAEFPDETVPQVWIDKETFYPLRMLIPSVHDNRTGMLEIRYTDWQKIENTLYPMQIEFIQDGIRVRAIEVQQYQIHTAFSAEIFDISRLMSEYRQSDQVPEYSGNQEGLSEVEKTIQDFKRIFE